MGMFTGRRLSVLAGAVLVLAIVPALAACAPRAVFTVTSVLDAADTHPGDGVCASASGTCTLRAAVQEANRAGRPTTIDLPPLTTCCGVLLAVTIPGADEDASVTGDLDISGNITIVGQPPSQSSNGTFLVGAGLDRLLDVQPGGSLTLDWVGVRGGAAIAGGGIRVQAGGAAQLNDVLVTDNEATGTLVCGAFCSSGLAPGGGGILNSGNLSVNRSQILGNRSGISALGCSQPIPVGAPPDTVAAHLASGETFCISGVGGGIDNDGTLAVVNTLISGNQAGPGGLFTGFGGGIYAHQGPSRTIVALSTIVDNISGSGQAVSGSFTTSGSVLGRSATTGGDACGQFHPEMSVSVVTSRDYNIVSDEFCYLRQPHDLQTVDPQVPFVYQGWYQSQVPTATSPALDAIPAGTAGICDGTLTVDLRNRPRPSGARCDIGAVERQPTDP